MPAARIRIRGFVVFLLVVAAGCGGGGGGGSADRAVPPSAPQAAPDPVPPPAAEPPPDPAPDPGAPPAAEPPPDPAPDPGAPSGPEPTVSLEAADKVVDDGASTQLSWTSSNADSCNASGSWSGPRPLAGTAGTGALTSLSTFTLNCDGAGGSAISMISVAVNGDVTLEWRRPTQNEDGSPLTDLAGYRIYYGDRSGRYADSIGLMTPDALSHAVVLPSGDYFLAMTAVDTEGNESAFSNEVRRSVD